MIRQQELSARIRESFYSEAPALTLVPPVMVMADPPDPPMSNKDRVILVGSFLAYLAIIVLIVYGVARAMDMGNFSW